MDRLELPSDGWKVRATASGRKLIDSNIAELFCEMALVLCSFRC
jgi:hypothetical protein